MLSLGAVRTGTRRYVFQGRSAPHTAGQVITLYRLQPGGNEIRTATGYTDASGAFHISRAFPEGGRITLRVRTSPSLDNAAGVSNPVTVDPH